MCSGIQFTNFLIPSGATNTTTATLGRTSVGWVCGFAWASHAVMPSVAAPADVHSWESCAGNGIGSNNILHFTVPCLVCGLGKILHCGLAKSCRKSLGRSSSCAIHGAHRPISATAPIATRPSRCLTHAGRTRPATEAGRLLQLR